MIKYSYGDYMKKGMKIIIVLILFILIFYLLYLALNTKKVTYNIEDIPDYSGKKYIDINDGKPSFTDSDYSLDVFEKYSDLDIYGRAGVAYAKVGLELMPTEERKSISGVKPSGWHTVKYDNVSGKYLYNRCHLIGFQLTGENANEKNLITCTRNMNSVTMLYYENLVAKYVKDTKDQVLYRVTPIYDSDALVAKGVLMESASVSDKCGKICFNVFVYNVQDGIVIDYATGDSHLAD